MEAQTPCVPLNTQDSSLPAAYFTFTFTNHGAAPVPVSLMEVQVRVSRFYLKIIHISVCTD